MARKRISEYKAKTLLLEYLSLPYQGMEIKNGDLSPISQLDKSIHYVVKVDQGIKKRFTLGLVVLNLASDKVAESINSLTKKGYSRFIIEPFVSYDPSDERYLSLTRTREGIHILTSLKGGIAVEGQKDSMREFVIPQHSFQEIAQSIHVPTSFIEKLAASMDTYHISFLEINPLVLKDNDILVIDLAVEVDSAGGFFVQEAWTQDDFVTSGKQKTEEEKVVDDLSDQSQASFKLDVLNKDGSIFMLLSGGGASIVLADEVYNQGFGPELANYGEYSGNPNAQETYHYTKQILSLLLASSASKKVLIIAGGVANFTDIRVTFRGIIQALSEVGEQLQKQRVKVFVRRGGPYQEEGLAMMEAFLQKENLLGFVSGPEMVLTEIVTKALEAIQT